jgi:hypothetical protein
MGLVKSELPQIIWLHDAPSIWIQVRCPFDDVEGVSRPSLNIGCREFTPQPDAILSERWQIEGKVEELQLPPYACVSVMFIVYH